MLMLTPAHARPHRHEQARPCWHSGSCCSMQSTPSLTHLFCLSANNYTSLLLFSPPSLSFCRCERTGPMRLFPSMPLAHPHRVPMSSAGWILALALLFALQVKFCSNCFFLISYNCFHLFQIYFLAAILFDFGNWSICKSIFSSVCFSLQAFLPFC